MKYTGHSSMFFSYNLQNQMLFNVNQETPVLTPDEHTPGSGTRDLFISFDKIKGIINYKG